MSEDKIAPHYNVHTTEFEAFPEYGGGKAILYRSADRKILAGSFKESGTHRMTMPFDEFIYVVGGGVHITIEGGESFALRIGDACYLRKGQDVTFEMHEGFHDVTVLISDEAIEE